MDLQVLRAIVVETVGLAQSHGMTIWHDPIIACASADDPLFGHLKQAVSPDHLMPYDLLPGAKTVLVYFLPFVKEIGVDNSRAHPHASKLWAKVYVETNALVARINEKLSDFLALHGYRAVVTPATHNFDADRLLSRWSHKHVGFIAGLGTFGLNRLLITHAGCCGRLGSLVTDAEMVPTQRPKEEFCLWKRNLLCSKCVDRCPAGAIDSRGNFDRHTCYRVLLENDRLYSDIPLTDVCGQCSCEVPCSYRIPISQGAQEPL
ncbi:MAG: epoxyqueuosine reductase [Thermodesulforhabdaceae bacterium]